MASRMISRQADQDDHFDVLSFIALMMIVLAVLLFITMIMASINIGAGAAEGWIPAKNGGKQGTYALCGSSRGRRPRDKVVIQSGLCRAASHKGAVDPGQ